MLDKIKNILTKFKRKKTLDFDELFNHFQQLIKENNRSLEIISDMGQKLSGEYVFDKHYIETSTEELSARVYEMIFHLEAMSPGKYTKLLNRYTEIRSHIEEELRGNIIIPEGSYVVEYSKIDDELEDAVGGKNAHLGVIKNLLGVEIPPGFAITTKGFSKIVKESEIAQEIFEILSNWDQGKITTKEASKNIQKLILNYPLPKDLLTEIHRHINKLKKQYKNESLYLAVRSSCIGEDSEHSFAGIYESYLGVCPDEVPTKYKHVLASAYSERALEYRKNKGIMESEIAMAVGCQKIIDPKVSGVMYTVDPFNIEEDRAVISAIYGFGEDLVGGKQEGDMYFVSRQYPNEIKGMNIVYKNRMKKLNPINGKVISTLVPDKDKNRPVLTNNQVKRLVQLGMRLEQYFKHPQDIEFAFDHSGTLYILQTRRLKLKDKKAHMVCNLDEIKKRFQVIFSNKGEIVQEGIAMGEVYLINSLDDLNNVPDQCILVATFTSPVIAKVIKKVNGIITDVGSPIGHLATIAREFRIPMIINTKNATKVLKNGQNITLNATDNIVYDGYLKELCYYEFNQDTFEETKEYRLLKRIFKRISPLNLVDPSSNLFQPDNCKTYHDIIRFIHEKAVSELIDQNTYRKYSGTNKGVRLKLDIPLDLVVIDITQHTVIKSRELTIDNISSPLLKAFVKGVSSENVWSTEPVSIGFRSFMASMNRTTPLEMADPKFVGQNLAVISKDYANISLRLGYHFTMIDSIAGNNSSENYIYFRFFGGVSENVKRSRRARLIGRILNEHDFFTEIRGDLVIARLKGMSKEEILEKIFVLGVLVAFTRQLDVRMEEEHSIDYFSKQFHEILLKQKIGNGELNI